MIERGYLYLSGQITIIEKRYSTKELIDLIDKTKEKIGGARDGQSLGEKLAFTVRMMLPVSFEGPFAGIAIERGEYFPGILVPAVTQYGGDLLSPLRNLPSEYNILLDLAGWAMLIGAMNYATPKAILAYEKRKVSDKLEKSKELIEKVPALLNLYGSMLEKALAEKSPYKYPLLETEKTFKDCNDSYYRYLDQTIRGSKGFVIRESGLGLDSSNIKYVYSDRQK